MKSVLISGNHAAVKMKFSIKDFFSKCDQICRKLQIWSHLLKKSITENTILVQCKCIEPFNDQCSQSYRN